MIIISCLSELRAGETAYIFSSARSPMRQRLCDLGIVGGTRIECVARAGLGGPSAYLVRGAVIALRREDADKIDISGISGRAADRAETVRHMRHISGEL